MDSEGSTNMAQTTMASKSRILNLTSAQKKINEPHRRSPIDISDIFAPSSVYQTSQTMTQPLLDEKDLINEISLPKKEKLSFADLIKTQNICKKQVKFEAS
jgi:hypothetical protein